MAKKAPQGSKRTSQRPKCPPIPDGWGRKFTTPAYVPGMTIERANALWAGYVRAVTRLRPMPRRTSK